ncbi:MAG: TldD/PmbA family protein [Oscillospiraceae bacterium]|nr:TldD/PmbA family protein [Oscillospiraceae bacterium]
MDFQGFKKAVIAKCEALGIADYELYYQSAESTSVSAFQHSIHQFTSSIEGGVCFRCIWNGKMGYASTEALSEAEASAVVERAVDNASVLEAEEQVFLGEGGKTYQALPEETREMPATDALIAKVLETQEQIYQADAAVVDGSSTQGIAERSETAIFNSRGLDLYSQGVLTGLVVAAVVTDGKEKTNDYQIKLAPIEDIDTEELTKKAAQTALSKLGGEVAPTGQYPVVFDPEAMSDLLSAFSGIFSSEAAQKGLSKLAGQEGKVIAGENITLIDDPFWKDAPMKRNFDAEGSPVYTKKVVENGKLNTLLYNLKTAAVAGKETTGNASKAGYAASVGISPFTFYLQPGDITEEELLQAAGNGVYINSLSGLHAGADAISGDFSLQSAGFMIENGEKTTAVKSFTVAGNFYELLGSIRSIASNLEMPGMGRFGAPSVLVDGLSVAGK